MSSGQKNALIKILFLFFLLSLSLFSSETYYIKFRFYGKAEGRLLKLIKYRAYAETFDELCFVGEKEGKFKILKLKKILTPPYYMQTIGFSGKEIHIRISGKTVNEAYLSGVERLKLWCIKYPELCKRIPEKKKKSLPFLFVGEPSFTFKLFNDFVVLESIKNRVYQKYAWPSKSFFPQPSFRLLEGALCFLNSAIPEKEEKVKKVNLTECFKLIVKKAPKTIRMFVKPEQKKDFYIKYKVERLNNGKIRYFGKIKLKNPLWMNYKIREYVREIIFKERSIVKNYIELKVCSKKNCGLGILLLEKIEPKERAL